MEYYDYLILLIVEDVFPINRYQKLLRKLYETEFIYILDRDANRASDGISLRYRFNPDFESANTEVPCSVLEMLVALANRCEEQIMWDPDKGNRRGIWFWNMIITLGLNVYDDKWYDESTVDYILNRFMKREYDSNGIGGLFAISNPPRDVTEVEIWEQLNWYLSEQYYNN